MAETLFPTYDIPEAEIADDSYDTEYRRAPRWDPVLGDFVLDGTGKIAEDDGQNAYMIWCLKVSQTERFACLAYPEEVGTELENATWNDDHGVVESMITRTVTEALMVNPRTVEVADFEFDWDGDEVHVACTVIPVNMEEFVLRF